MKRHLFLGVFCGLIILALPSFAAVEKFVDCGPGYVMVASKNRDGIQSFECKRLWCRDLENGKSMGTGGTPSNGYEITAGSFTYNYYGETIECFGRRRWCIGEDQGVFNEDLGIYTKPGADNALYTGRLQGNCYKWQLQSNNCRPDQIAINDGINWICVSQGFESEPRNAIKLKAIRRSPGVTRVPRLK